MKDREKALRKFLCLTENDVLRLDAYEDNLYALGNEEYLVLTEEEADKKVKDQIIDEVWAFNADFILHHNDKYDEMSNYEYESAKQSIQKAQGELAEFSNGFMKCLISDMDKFVEDAVDGDGRGHFLAFYDGDENEEEINGVTYYIYRRN